MPDFTSAVPTGGDPLRMFDAVVAAAEQVPLPPGRYRARTVRGDYFDPPDTNSLTRYSITFEVIEGDHTGRTVRRTWWFTEKALPYTRRDLNKFGLGTSEKLLRPFPDDAAYVCDLVIAIKKNDLELEFNEVKDFRVVSTEAVKANPFAIRPADVLTAAAVRPTPPVLPAPPALEVVE